MNIWIELLGALIILLAACVIGETEVKKLKETRETEEELIEFVKYAREQIKNYKRPLDEIVSTFKGHNLESYGFLTAIVENTPETSSGKLPIDEEHKKTLSSFLREFGKGCCEEQTALCDEYLFQMSNKTKKTTDEYQSKIRIYRMLPLLGAISLIIILI